MALVLLRKDSGAKHPLESPCKYRYQFNSLAAVPSLTPGKEQP
jgi:hypothetical protein